MSARRVRERSRWLRRVVMGLAVAVATGIGMAACGSDGGGTDPEEPAQIEVAVTADGVGVAGVSVQLFRAGSGTALTTRQTGSSGSTVFSGLDPGSYEVEIEVPADHELAEGESARQSVTAVAGSTQRVEIGLTVVSDVVEISLTSGLRFEPSSVTIAPGTTIRWVNAAQMFHTITPDGHSEWERREVSTNGETFTHVFDGTGVFDYFCEPHEGAGMVGTITVEE